MLVVSNPLLLNVNILGFYSILYKMLLDVEVKSVFFVKFGQLDIFSIFTLSNHVYNWPFTLKIYLGEAKDHRN